MSGKRAFKRPTKARSKQLIAGVRRGLPTRQRAFRVAKGLSNKWQGGFTINRWGQTWSVYANGDGSVLASPDAGVSTGSVLNLGTPEVVAGLAGNSTYNIPFAMSFSLDAIANYTELNIGDKYLSLIHI